MSEDAERHLGEFVDCLMQAARPTGLLLGAGCPCSVRNPTGTALIPDIAGLTVSAAAALHASPHGAAWDALVMTCTEDGELTPTIEQMLDRIRGLKSYAGAATIRGLTRAHLETLELTISSHIVAVASVDLPAPPSPYHALALWTKANTRLSPVEIFTTNYDLLIEQGLEGANVPVFDGFVGSCRPFFDVESVSNDSLPSRWARLWKIHGSVNWQHDKKRKEIYRSVGGTTAVIHPSHLKYDESRKLPYLALIDRLRRFVRSGQPILITCGYSFRDQHINEVIIDALSANPAAIVFGLLFGDMDQYPDAQSLAARATNLRLYASDSCIVGGSRSDWLGHKAKPEEKFPPGIIEWISTGAPPIWQPKVHCGDFLRLGDLLYFVTQGRQPRSVPLTIAAS